jgi:hypothetical protein
MNVAGKRIEVKVDLKDRDRDPVHQTRKPVKAGTGNLYSSEVKGKKGIHMPTLDIDMECMLVESTTKGHFHLYIEKEMPWDVYRRLLLALAEAEIIQEGFCGLSIARGASYVRKPDVQKKPDEWPDS